MTAIQQYDQNERQSSIRLLKEPTPMASKPSIKVPNNDAVAEMARLIVKKEIGRMIGTKGARGLMRISAILSLVHPEYRAYYDILDKGEIKLDTIYKHFSPEVWAAMPTAKRRTLEAGIKKEVELVKKRIHEMSMVLWQNDTELSTLSLKGQAALQLVMSELMGEVKKTELSSKMGRGSYEGAVDENSKMGWGSLEGAVAA